MGHKKGVCRWPLGSRVTRKLHKKILIIWRKKEERKNVYITVITLNGQRKIFDRKDQQTIYLTENMQPR